MKKFIAGMVAGLVLSGSVFAATYVAEKADFKILVNGENFTSDPPAVTIEGKTYLPLRAMAEALGVGVTWNGDKNQVEVGESAEQPDEEQSDDETNAETSEFSRNNPAPLNTVQNIDYSDYTDTYSASVSVLESIRGEEAWAKIYEANEFNDEPEDGYEYILAKISVSMKSVDNDKSISINSFSFNSYSTDNVKYDGWLAVVTPEPELSTDMFAGGSTEGWVAFKVKKDDATPKIVFGQQYDGTGGIWFSLN